MFKIPFEIFSKHLQRSKWLQRSEGMEFRSVKHPRGIKCAKHNKRGELKAIKKKKRTSGHLTMPPPISSENKYFKALIFRYFYLLNLIVENKYFKALIFRFFFFYLFVNTLFYLITAWFVNSWTRISYWQWKMFIFLVVAQNKIKKTYINFYRFR